MLTIPGTINQAVGAVTGFTTPTYTTAASATTFPNGKGYVVTAKGGTQPGSVDVHSASRPFSFLVTRPPVVKLLPAVNSAGRLSSPVPVNAYTIGTRKGLTVLAGQPSEAGYVKTTLGIPAGADLADPNNVAAMILAHAMSLAQIAQGMIDTAITGEA